MLHICCIWWRLTYRFSFDLTEPFPTYWRFLTPLQQTNFKTKTLFSFASMFQLYLIIKLPFIIVFHIFAKMCLNVFNVVCRKLIICGEGLHLIVDHFEVSILWWKETFSEDKKKFVDTYVFLLVLLCCQLLLLITW